MDGAPLIELIDVSKRFGGIQALRDVTLAIERGTVHGLVGENGAGKSTLGKLLAGVHRPDSGEIRHAGHTTDFRSPRDALEDGVTLIAQELALVPRRSVIENVFLGVESSTLGLVDRKALLRRYHELDVLRFGISPDVPVGALRTADQQKVEIMRSLAREARVIVMDEPTASLSPQEAGTLFETVRHLADGGTTIVFISHFLDDVLSLCDTITVLKDGAVVRTAPAAEENADKLVLSMIGRTLETTFPPKRPPADDAPVALKVDGLGVPGKLSGITFEVRRGEIVGLSGLIGSGRTEVARAIFGAEHATEGTISLDGAAVRIRSPREAVGRGIALLPESRKQGLLLRRSIVENVSLPHLSRFSTWGVMRRQDERRAVAETFERVGTPAARNLAAPVGSLSGGNQQKVLFAKWLLSPPTVLIADEPTRGIDVGAKAAIYELLAGLAAAGLAVVLISSEHEEILGLAHTVVVLRNGRMAGTLHGDEADTESILRLAFGAPATGAAA